MNNLKSYKIIVHSKKMRNIRGSSPVEVAKKVASKLSNKYFSIIEVKTNKIIHYYSDKKELLRPYTKNGKLVKYRIIVKKIGKQIGGTYPPNLTNRQDPIYTFFPRNKYFIRFIEYHKRMFIQNESNKEWCSDFSIKEKTLFIENLNKCNRQSGRDTINNIINYGKYLKEKDDIIDQISLDDESRIEIMNHDSFSLSLLSILSTGMSWYNSFHFFTEKSEEERAYNARFLGMKLEDFLKECIRKKLEKILKEQSERNSLSKNDFKENIRLELTNKKDEFIKRFGDLNVNELFISIKDILKNHEKLSKEELDKIIELLNFIESSEIIMYTKENLKLIL